VQAIAVELPCSRSHAGRLAALAELADVADGRVDLLAEEAGLAIGFHD
jgi:hypothetical protein